MLAFLLQPEEAANAASKAGLSIIESSLLGAITVLALTLAVVAIWKVLKVQDARVADVTSSTKDRDQILAEIIDLNKRMIETFSSMKASIDRLCDSEQQGQEVLRGMRQAMDTVVLSAVSNKGTKR